MRKIGLITISFLVGFFLISCTKKENVQSKSAIVNFFSGNVNIIKDNREAKIKVGDIITSGTTVITGNKSFVEIYIDENAIKILPETVIEFKALVKNISQNSESVKLFVKKGKIFSKVARKLAKGDSYEVSTPTSIAAVRGTSFLVSEVNGKSNVACLDGKIRVRDAAKTDKDALDIDGGQEVDVEKNKALNPKDLSKKNKKNLKEILDGIKNMKQSIKDKYKETKDKIDKSVKDQKEKNRENIDKVENENRENISNIKNQTKEDMNAIKGTVKEDKEKSSSAVKNFKKPDMKSIKPDFSKIKPGNK